MLLKRINKIIDLRLDIKIRFEYILSIPTFLYHIMITYLKQISSLKRWKNTENRKIKKK